jgi:hypothetical protein
MKTALVILLVAWVALAIVTCVVWGFAGAWLKRKVVPLPRRLAGVTRSPPYSK